MFLPGKSHGQRSLAMVHGIAELDTTTATEHTHTHTHIEHAHEAYLHVLMH